MLFGKLIDSWGEQDILQLQTDIISSLLDKEGVSGSPKM